MSSEDVRNTLTSQIDKVSQNPTARNVGQLNATVQAESSQVNASANRASAVGKTVNTVVAQGTVLCVDGVRIAQGAVLQDGEPSLVFRLVFRLAEKHRTL